jgi:hypothetical protein
MLFPNELLQHSFTSNVSALDTVHYPLANFQHPTCFIYIEEMKLKQFFIVASIKIVASRMRLSATTPKNLSTIPTSTLQVGIWSTAEYCLR